MTVAIAVHATALATLVAPATAGPAIAAAAVVAAAAKVAAAAQQFAAFDDPVFAAAVVASVLVVFGVAEALGLTGVAVAAAAAAAVAAVMSLAETPVGLWRSADPRHLECQVDNKYSVKCRTDIPGPSSRHKVLQKISLCPLSA